LPTFHLAAAALAMQAQSIGDPLDLVATGVCTDTREGAAGAIFFALPGENQDGHAYVARAFQLGAVAAVVTRPTPGATGLQLLVDDPLAALTRLAAWHRARHPIPVVGVTGSVGKTSTRDMIACVLSATKTVHVSPRNFNNEIGVPRSLLAIEPTHEVAVIELGMRGPGQIADLCRLVQPRVGVVTNIGVSHIELLGSRDAIATAKGELLQALPADGRAVLPADDDFAPYLAGLCRCPVTTFGQGDTADVRPTAIALDGDGCASFRIGAVPFALRAPGAHQVANAAAACAVGLAFGVTLEQAAERLRAYRPPSMRMHLREAPHGVTIVDDAYNAAPDSMRAALTTLAAMGEGRRKVAFLGDMRELGDEAAAAHRTVGELAAQSGLDLLATVGDLAEQIAQGAAPRLSGASVVRFADSAAAAAAAMELVRPGDLVLVKGSRAMEMERIVERLLRG
jgi:UDP-N-acetylmuramoyl-tripeptide--D-alanyl-D-alanine ligase